MKPIWDAPAAAANESMLPLLAASFLTAFSASQIGFILASYALRSSSIVLSWAYLLDPHQIPAMSRVHLAVLTRGDTRPAGPMSKAADIFFISVFVRLRKTLHQMK